MNQKPDVLALWDPLKTIKENAFICCITFSGAKMFQYRYKLGYKSDRDGKHRRLAVKCFGIDNQWNNTYKTFESAAQASRELKVSLTGISNCLNKRAKTAGGFRWQYAEAQHKE